MLKKYTSILISILLALITINCKSQNIEQNKLQDIIGKYPYILFSKFGGSNTVGAYVLFNLANKKEIKLFDDIREYSDPQLLNHGKNLIMFGDYILHKGSFSLIYLQDNSVKKLSIRNRLDFHSDYDFIRNFDQYDDSTIIFGFRDKIYEYSVFSDSLNPVKRFSNKLIEELKYDSKYHRIFFTYQDGLNSTEQNCLGIYSFLTDSVLYSSIRINSLGNSSPNGKYFSFSSFYSKSGLYDLENGKINYYEFQTNNLNLEQPYFIDDNTLLLSSFNISKPTGGNLYLYDLDKKKIKEQLTDNNYNISNIIIHIK